MFSEHEILDLRPCLSRRHTLKRSAHYGEEIAGEVDDWFLSYGLLPDDRSEAAVRQMNCTYLTALCWPAASRNRLIDLACLALALNIRDHEFDTHHRGRVAEPTHKFLADLAHGFSTRADDRWSPVFADVWHRLESYLSRQFMQRLADTIADYLHGCIAYDHHLLERGEPRNVEQYLEWRHRTIGQRIDHCLAEISIGVELPTHVLGDPGLRRLREAEVRRTVFVQDILSAKKELFNHEQENIVPVIARDRNCSLREAMDLAIAGYEEALNRFDQVQSVLLASPLADHHGVRRWIEALDDFHAGLLEWSTGCSRYTLLPESSWTAPARVIDENGFTDTRSSSP